MNLVRLNQGGQVHMSKGLDLSPQGRPIQQNLIAELRVVKITKSTQQINY